MSRTSPAALGALFVCGAISIAARAGYADSPPPEQILIIPLTGDEESATRLTVVVSDAFAAAEREVVTARARGADISGIAGCTAETPDCFRNVADTIGVDAVVFGTVDRGEDGATIVTLTYIGRDADPRTRELVLQSTNPDDAATELRPRVDAFVAGEPDPVASTQPGEPPPEPDPAPAPAPAQGGRGGSFDFGRVKTYAWATLGGGAGAVAVGLLFYALAGSKQSAVDDAPTDTAEDIRHLQDLESAGKRYTTMGNILTIGGGVAVAVGGVLVFVQARSGGRERPSAISVAPTAAGDGMTVVFGGTF